jgi:hypothetical protein
MALTLGLKFVSFVTFNHLIFYNLLILPARSLQAYVWNTFRIKPKLGIGIQMLFSQMTRKLEYENLFMTSRNTSLLVLLSLMAMCTFTIKSRKIDSAASQVRPSGENIFVRKPDCDWTCSA